jgi:hypothetical protein
MGPFEAKMVSYLCVMYYVLLLYIFFLWVLLLLFVGIFLLLFVIKIFKILNKLELFENWVISYSLDEMPNKNKD